MGLTRAYYSAFHPIIAAPFENLPYAALQREHRLYQSSFLLRDYGFEVEDLPFENGGNLNPHLDPKRAWADANLRHAPIDLTTAERTQLLRVPGIGLKGADAILRARRHTRLTELIHRRAIHPDRREATARAVGIVEGDRIRMNIDRQTVVNAWKLIAYKNQPNLWPPLSHSQLGEYNSALQQLTINPSVLPVLIEQELEKWPLTNRYMGELIRDRLTRAPLLGSPIIETLFNRQDVIENRLYRTHLHIGNFEETLPQDGNLSEEVFLDVWNELFVADKITSSSNIFFSDVQKIVVEDRRLPHADFAGIHNNIHYVVEATRLHSKNFEGQTMPNYTDAFDKGDNRRTLSNVVKHILRDKNRQLGKTRSTDEFTFYRSMLVVKTSQT